MSLSEKSKRINKIFGTVKIYNKSAGTWTYVATPEIGDFLSNHLTKRIIKTILYKKIE